MSGRDVTPAVETALQESVIRPVLIGWLDFASDPVYAWTGPNTFAPSGTGDAALNGNFFTPFAPFIKLSGINENRGVAGPVTLTLSGHDLDEVALRQIVRDKRQWRGRQAILWMGLLSADESTVLDDPVRVRAGKMTMFNVIRDKDDYTVTVTIDEDVGNSKSGPWRILDHARIYPTDTFSTYLVKLANKPHGLDRYDVNPLAHSDDALQAEYQMMYGQYGYYR